MQWLEVSQGSEVRFGAGERYQITEGNSHPQFVSKILASPNQAVTLREYTRNMDGFRFDDTVERSPKGRQRKCLGMISKFGCKNPNLNIKSSSASQIQLPSRFGVVLPIEISRFRAQLCELSDKDVR